MRPLRVGICGTDYHIYEGKHPFLELSARDGSRARASRCVEAPAGSGFAPGEICVVNPYISCGTCIACRRGKPNCCVGIAVLGVHRDGGMAGAARPCPRQNLFAPRASASMPARRSSSSPSARTRCAVRTSRAGTARAGHRRGSHRSWRRPLRHALRRPGQPILDRDAGAPRRPPGRWSGPAHHRGRRHGARRRRRTDRGRRLRRRGSTRPATARSMQKRLRFRRPWRALCAASAWSRAPIIFEDADFHRKEMTLLGSRNAHVRRFRARSSPRSARPSAVLDQLITHRTTLAGAVARPAALGHAASLDLSRR